MPTTLLDLNMSVRYKVAVLFFPNPRVDLRELCFFRKYVEPLWLQHGVIVLYFPMSFSEKALELIIDERWSWAPAEWRTMAGLRALSNEIEGQFSIATEAVQHAKALLEIKDYEETNAETGGSDPDADEAEGNMPKRPRER